MLLTIGTNIYRSNSFYDNIRQTSRLTQKNVFFSPIPDISGRAEIRSLLRNYVPKEFDGSSVGRMLFVVFSDYYHQRTEDNDYLETRQIRTDL